ncbi:MAG: hypothetical protein ABI598_00590, partial [Chloroflexota bacterium]
MNASRVLAVARRIIQGFRRDERTLGLIFVVPIVITALLGWMIRDQKDVTVGAIIVNGAGAPGQRLVDALITATIGAPDGIEVVAWTDTEASAIQSLRDDNGDIAIVLPSSLIADVTSEQRPVLKVITRGTDPAEDAAAFGALQSLVVTLSSEVSSLTGGGVTTPRIEHETIFLEAGADELDVLAPVFLAYFAYFFVFMLTGI